jgi:hypothetical protein
MVFGFREATWKRTKTSNIIHTPFTKKNQKNKHNNYIFFMQKKNDKNTCLSNERAFVLGSRRTLICLQWIWNKCKNILYRAIEVRKRNLKLISILICHIVPYVMTFLQKIKQCFFYFWSYCTLCGVLKVIYKKCVKKKWYIRRGLTN